MDNIATIQVRKVIEEWQHKAFSYNGADCCRFAAACVLAMTGRDPMAGMQYHNERAAVRIVRSFGSLHNAVCSVMGEPSNRYEQGDVTIQTMAGGEIVGILYQGQSVVRTKTSLVNFPMARISASWTP